MSPDFRISHGAGMPKGRFPITIFTETEFRRLLFLVVAKHSISLFQLTPEANDLNITSFNTMNVYRNFVF